jgi:hypothetical protein
MTPIIVVTSYLGHAYAAPEPTPDLCLEKPVDPEELIAIANELLKKGGGGSATPE